MSTRRVVVDSLSGREVAAGPEETDATQPFVDYLQRKIGWDPGQIMTRPQWRVPKQPSGNRLVGYPIDVAVFDAPRFRGHEDHVRILVECKAPDKDTGITQLKTYLSLEPEARVGVWFNGARHVVIYKTRDGFLSDENGRIPKPSDPLGPPTGHIRLTFRDLAEPPNLSGVFLRLRDRIAAQDSHVNRDEFILNDLANLLISKILDEQDGELDSKGPLSFQLAGSRAETAETIRGYFDSVRKRLPSVFNDESDRLHIDDASLEEVVRTLQGWRLLGHDRQAVGKAFQVLRGRALKGEEGAYFTPPLLVDCAVSLLDPSHRTSIIDPAAGTGGFLAAALNQVFGDLDKKKLDPARRAEAKRQWAGDSLFAVSAVPQTGRKDGSEPCLVV